MQKTTLFKNKLFKYVGKPNFPHQFVADHKDQELQRVVFSYFHESSPRGHSSIHATRQRLATMVYWKGMHVAVKN